MPDVLVLGGDGFIGSHLCDALLDRGLTVRAFDRLHGDTPRNLVARDGLEIQSGDFLNRHDLELATADVRFVVHLISTTTPATSGADPVFDVETNVRGSVELFEICCAAGVERVIFASTGGAIYGRDIGRALRETDAPAPISPYAIGKLAIEGYLRYYRQARSLDSLCLRISNPYGERQPIVGAQGVVPIFMKHMLSGEPITVFGDGSMVRDYLYVGDLAHMIAEVVDRPATHHVYNVGSGEACSVLRLLELLEEAVGVPARIEHAPHRPTDVQRVLLDVERFTTEFGLQAQTSMPTGIARTADHVRDVLARAASELPA